MVGAVTCIPIPGEQEHLSEFSRAEFHLPNFICGPENRLAGVVLERVLAFAVGLRDPIVDSTSKQENLDDHHRPITIPNPIVFIGPTGCGKTHIIEGIVAQWKARYGNEAALCTTAVDFARRLSEADDAAVRREIRISFRSRSLLAIDNLDNLPRRRTIHEELIYSLDTVDRHGGLVLVTSAEPPGRLPKLSLSLRSRLCQGLVVALAPPDRLARCEIVRHLSKQRGVNLSEIEISRFADLPEPSPRAIAHRLAHWHFNKPKSQEKRSIAPDNPISQPIDVSTLSSTPSLRMITSIVSRNFSLRQTAIRGKSRRQSIVYARGVAMYLARELTNQSLAKIGAEYGGRDHTTVLHACRKISDLITHDPETRSVVEKLKRVLLCD